MRTSKLMKFKVGNSVRCSDKCPKWKRFEGEKLIEGIKKSSVDNRILYQIEHPNMYIGYRATQLEPTGDKNGKP